MKYMRLSAVIAGLVMLAAGCTPNGQGNNQTGNPSVVAPNTSGTRSQGNPDISSNHRLTVEQSIATQVAQISPVHKASVLVVGENAYVAVQLNGSTSNPLAAATKERIVATVKQHHKTIRHVYVSANPGAYQQFVNFTNDLANGHPDTAWNQFQGAVQRLWPSGR
ncbi:hypothetical protein D2Q93_12520 [Alicyclobacillaceae bacterium I2511]|nr:hypothetical protein D2Q93_12520 [Alicyclobacillaceae bacterium I2511]